MTIALTHYRPAGVPTDLLGKYDVRSSWRLVVTTGLLTVVAAATATAGFVFTLRWSSATTTKLYVKRVGIRWIVTTAYGTAQETGFDMICARSYTASCTGGTAVDMGSSVADTGQLSSGFGTSLIVANATRIATTDAFTAGTHTLDANPIGRVGHWSTAIGDMLPEEASHSADGFANLWDYRDSAHGMPLKFTQDEGFMIRNTVLMGATGVGRLTVLVEADEAVPQTL